jgi:hypothetical protein
MDFFHSHGVASVLSTQSLGVPGNVTQVIQNQHLERSGAIYNEIINPEKQKTGAREYSATPVSKPSHTRTKAGWDIMSV